MFDVNTPMRLVGCAGKQVKDGGDKRRVLVLSFQLQPFTAEMAASLNIKSRLFSARTGEALPEVLSTKLAIDAPMQTVSIRTAPDTPRASVTIPEVEVAPAITVRKDREGPVYSATLVILADYPSGNDLLFLMQRVTEQFFVTFEAVQGNMLRQPPTETEDEDDDIEPQARPAPSTSH